MNTEAIIKFFEQELGYQLPEPNAAGEVFLACPFHHDTKPSMSLNIETGLWKCFTCDIGGSPADFYMELHGVSYAEAKNAIEEGEHLPTVSPQVVARWHNALLRTKKMLRWLETKRGITRDTVERFTLGYDGERITIPIHDYTGKLVNVRRYKPGATDSQKVISYDAGYGKARLFPVDSLTKKTVVVCEGEMDAILAKQMGLPAVTQTAGAGTWNRSWNKQFKGKVVFICYDNDEQGRMGAQKVAKALMGVAKRVHIVELPVKEPGEDLTDYFVKYENSPKAFKKLCKETEPVAEEDPHGGELGTVRPENDEAIKIPLAGASHRDLFHKRIKMNVIVSGKDLAPYLVPKTVRYTCSMEEGKKCAECSLGDAMGEYTMTINDLNPILLELIECPAGQQTGILRQTMGLPQRCRSHQIDIEDAYNVEEVFLMPEIDFADSTSEYVQRRAFYVGHGLRTNQLYEVEGITLPEPHRQYATHLLNVAKPACDDVGSFEMDKDVVERLSVFRPARGQSVAEKMDEIHRDFVSNVTHIYGRNDLLTVFDLTYHSVISFEFQHKMISKGWVESLVIGDTRTGKSESLLSLMRHYRMGEMVTGENTSFAGLVGGMLQNQKRWTITWGKIPSNDRRLVAIDEASSMSEDTIARMSGLRSSGVAEITKIQTERTHARTRMIMMANPRKNNSLSAYSFGVIAIKELIGAPEDIARFDVAIACANSDVPLSVINAEYDEHQHVKPKYTSGLCNELIRWVWSRKPGDVVFKPGVESLILELATKQGERYSNRVPIIEAASHRIKIAKLSVAVAARLFSTNASGEKIVVKKSHVRFVSRFLDKLYESSAMGYAEYSRQQQKNIEIADEQRESVIKILESEADLADIFATYSYVRPRDLEDLMDCGKEEAQHYIRELARKRMLFKTTNGYRKSPAFIHLLREFIGDDD